MDCLFCRIIAGDVPALRVYEDDQVIAFLDIFPVQPGHTLVVPKAHHKTCMEMPDALMGDWMRAVKRVAQGLEESLSCDGINLLQNNHAAAGQVIPHVHMHVIPRWKGDGFTHWPSKELPRGELEAVADRVRLAIQSSASTVL